MIFVQETEKKNGEEKEENIWQGFARMVRMVTVMAMHVQLCTYLMFVNFGTPPHYLGHKKYTKKCINLRQNRLKGAKILRSH